MHHSKPEKQTPQECTPKRHPTHVSNCRCSTSASRKHAAAPAPGCETTGWALLGPQQSKGSARFTPQPRGDTQRWMVGVVSSILGSTPAAAHQWGILVSKPGAPKPPCSQRPHWSTKVCLCHGSHLEIRGACLCKFAGMGALYMSIRQFTVICRLCGYAS